MPSRLGSLELGYVLQAVLLGVGPSFRSVNHPYIVKYNVGNSPDVDSRSCIPVVIPRVLFWALNLYYPPNFPPLIGLFRVSFKKVLILPFDSCSTFSRTVGLGLFPQYRSTELAKLSRTVLFAECFYRKQVSLNELLLHATIIRVDNAKRR